MVKFEDTADDGEGVTEGMNEESNKKINHEVQYVRTFAEKADRLFLHNQTEYFIESIFIQQTEHSISPISAQFFFKAIESKIHFVWSQLVLKLHGVSHLFIEERFQA